MNKKCYLCDSSDIKKIKEGVRDNSAINVYKCKNCGLEFLSEVTSKDNFYKKGEMHSKISIENWLKKTSIDDKRRIKQLEKYLKNKKVLDFGAGSGGFVTLAKKYAKLSIGYEIDESLQDYYSKNGIDIRKNLKNIDEKFDIITLFHVLEHLNEPENHLKTLINMLKDNGKLVIEVPNSNDALLTLYKNESFKNFTYWSCHVFGYNSKNLKLLFNKVGLKCEKVIYTQRFPYTNHLGWLKDKKAGGHLRYKTNNIINCIYIKILKLLNKTDTILMILSKK